MDKFKKQLESRNKWLCVLLVVYFVMGIMVRFVLSDDNDIGNDFLMGLFMGLCILALVYLLKSRKAINDETKLRELYIRENDERKMMIKQRMCQSSLIVIIIGLMFAISIAVYIHLIVAYTLMITAFVMMFIVLGFKIYYSRKYE